MDNIMGVFDNDNTLVLHKPLVPIKELKKVPKGFMQTADGTLIKIPAQLSVGPAPVKTRFAKEIDKRRGEIQLWKEEELKKKLELAEAIEAVVKMTLPSTYIGPLFNNNGKSYTDNLLSGEGTGDLEGNLAIDLITPFIANKAISIGKNLYVLGPKYIFDNLPYKTIYNIEKEIKNLGKDTKEFFRTPINENPIAAVKARRYKQNVGTLPRTDVGNYGYYNTNNSPILNIDDPIPLIRKRLSNRLLNKDYMYSYPNDGVAIYLDDKMYDANHLISKIPVKEYLPLKEVYKIGLGRNPRTFDKIITAIQTPYKYVSLNMAPGFAWGRNFIKINKKALRDFGFDVPTTLSHEYNHALRNAYFMSNGKDFTSKMSPFLKKLAFDYSHLPEKIGNYLNNSTEIEARGTQLKNYFDTDVITPDMLKYASQHYVPDTGMNNNMYLFFSGIKDWNAAADYLTKYSLKNGGKLKLRKHEWFQD